MGTPRTRHLRTTQPARRPPVARVASLLLALPLAGCADTQLLRKNCPPQPDPAAAAASPSPAAEYRIGCPDVLEVGVDAKSDWDAVVAVDLDGRLPLGDARRPRVEGLTLAEAREAVAAAAGVPADRVRVDLLAPRASRVYVYGPIRGRLRAVPYQGPEPVIDFLKRVGGLPPGSLLDRVYVVRPSHTPGAKGEVIRIDVAAVLLDGDQRTNVPLRPSDEVYVGESRLSSLSRVLPDWMQPVYRRIAGLLPEDWWPWRRVGDEG